MALDDGFGGVLDVRVPQDALDNPYWHAMTGPQANVALGAGKARRYPARVGPQAALQEASPDAYRDLERLVEPGETVAFLAAEPPSVPPGWEEVFGLALEQRVCRRLGPSRAVDATPLGEDDLPAMLALAEATRPGPFLEGALALGSFVGLWEGSRLIAMAGIRAHLDGYREITAVCTVPDRRGRGLASALVSRLSNDILTSGETPFLHVRADNDPAIRAYERLGFERRRSMRVRVVRRGAA